MENIDNANGWMEPIMLVEWAKSRLDIQVPNAQMTNDDIRKAIRFIGDCSIGTTHTGGGKTSLGRIGIDNMLLVTMMVFPAYYMQYELAQRN
jgi:hypothetical protein